MDVAITITSLLAGVALVVAGADALVDGVVGLGRRLGVAPFVLTVLLSGFELENLAAGIAANARGLPGAAAGTSLGGATFLALGVAGLGALLAPMKSELPRRFLVWTAVSPLPAVLLARDGLLSRFDGAILVVWFVIVLAGVARSGGALVQREPEPRASRPLARLLVALAAVTGGGIFLSDGLRRAVRDVGVSATLLGNTAIAASVELEEVGRVAVPTRRGRPDLALANIAGTIVHFLAFNLGVIALVRPMPLDHATRVLHVPVAAGATVLLCAILAVSGRLGRFAGAILVALYAAYVAVAIAVV